MELAHRVVRRFLASRPIPIDKAAIKTFVEKELVPRVVHGLKHFADEKPLMRKSVFAEAEFDIEAVDHKETLRAIVQVDSIPATGKWAAVLRGSAGRRKFENGRGTIPITLSLNGALSPAEYLAPSHTMTPDRMQPLSSCTSETCLPYGLYSTLIHELTHAAEAMFGQEPNYYRDDGQVDQDAYINNPAEVRAFMQQVVDEAVRHAPALRAHARDNRKFVDLCLKMSTTWMLIKDDMNPANRAKILKNVYTALEEKGLMR